MPSFHHHEMEGRDLVGDAIHDSANPSKRKKEANRRHEQATAWAIGDALVKQNTESGALQQQKHQCCARTREQQDEPCIGHTELEHGGMGEKNFLDLSSDRSGDSVVYPGRGFEK
jgi:hypothetical protein